MQLLIVWAVSIIVFLGPSRLWASDPIPPDASSEKEQVAKRIAIVSTFRQLSPLNADWQRGIMEAVRKNYNGPIEFEIEYLDLIHNNDPMYLQGWIDLLSTKYAKKPADVVVPIYIPSLSFLLTNKQNIFQNTPIIFCSVPHSFAEFAISKYPVTGVGFEFDFKGTYKAIEALRPGTKRIVYLCGASEQDTFLRDSAELEQKNAHRDLQLEFWEGLTVPEARRKLSQLNNDTAVVALSTVKDRLGNHYTTYEYLQSVSDASPVPIYSLYDTLLGSGVVGGSMISTYRQGLMTGDKIAQYLNGVPIKDIPLTGAGDHRLAFDVQLLKKYNLRSANLPPSAELLNQQPTLWEQYGRYLALATAVLFLQSMIIVSLLVNRKKRLNAEREARMLAGKILSSIEDERRYIARELHDDVSQRLAATAIATGNLENKTSDHDQLKPALTKLKEQIISICDDLHHMSHRMHPSSLDDIGLPEALRSECRSLGERSGITIEYSVQEPLDPIPNDASLCLYRVAQESLWNSAKHSGSNKVSVRLYSDSEFAYLDITDDGCGFDLTAKKLSSGLGLASMKERMRLVAGHLKMQTSPGNGVAIQAIVPIASPNA